jgi:hypothetical protein
MAIKLKTGNTNWANLKKVFAKTGTSTWSPVKEVFAKLTTGWQKIWPGNAPAVNENDPIDIRLTSYSGARATSPQYINVKLYGNDGSYTGTTPIVKSGRKMRVASDSSGNGTRSVVENSDIFDMSTATATDRFYADGWYLFYELRASNIDGDLDAFSPPIKIIKRVPQFSGVSLDGTVDIGQQLTFSFTAQNFYYNSPDYLNSYVRWWRNTSKVPGGIILRTDDLYDVNRVGTAWGDGYQNSPTSITANSTYDVQSADVAAGTYVIAELVLVNSYHDHFGGSTGTYISSGDAPVVDSVYFRDNNDNNGFDNSSLSPYFQPKLPVATPLSLKANISGVTPETTYRVRYRIYNANTGVYWRPFDQVAASSGTAAWQTYTPSVSFSGGSSIITDVFVIDSSTFNGGTYSFAGSNYPTWELEIEVSAVRPGFARVYGDPIFQYISYSLGRTSVPSISASPSTGGSPLTVTFSGQITAFPAGNAYPRAYRINYGDGQISSWQTFATNSANPTYSNTYTYTSQGTFTASIETWPAFTTDSDTVSVISVPNAPTSLTATTSRNDGVLLNWNAVSGANYYEIYWQSIQGGGPVNQSTFADFGQDNSITTNSFLDTSIPLGQTRYYRVRARSASTSSGLNCSNWFPNSGTNGVTGTRIQVTPGIPTWISAVANGNGSSNQSISLSWNASSNAARYELFFNGNGSTPLDTNTADYGGSAPFITGTSYVTPGIFFANSTYYWWVRAVSSDGTKSGWSLVRSVTTNSDSLTAPTITSVVAGNLGGAVTVNFTGGSGPFYQIYWTTGSAPTTAVPIDGSGSSSPITDSTGPGFSSSWKMYIRSTSTLTQTAVGPSSLASAWSAGFPFDMTVPAPVNTVAPTLTPTSIAVGTVLTAGVGTWSNSPTSYDIRIYRGTANVSTGETLSASGTGTSLTYTVTQADFDSGQRYFRTYVNATNSGGSSGFVAGQERGPIATPVITPTNATAPTISGGLAVGTVITFGVGTWNNSPTSYDLRLYRGTQFVSSGETLSKSAGNVTSSTYTITQADFNSTQKYFRAFASATNAGGTSSLIAGGEIGPITAAPVAIPSGGSVTLTGTAQVGQTLSASTSGWSGSPTSYDIRIVRGTAGVIIGETLKASSATSSVSYTIAAEDQGFYFKAFASATNSGGTSSFASSAERGPTSAAPPPTAPGAPTGVSVSGSGSVSWTAPTSGGAVASYEIEFFTASNSSGSNASSSNSVIGIPSSPYQLGSPYGGTNANYARARVRARNAGGASSYSAWFPSSTTYV